MPPIPRLHDYFLLHFVVLIWGFTAILGKLITIPSVELVLYRTGGAAAMLWGWLFFRRTHLHLSQSQMLKIAGTGVFIAAHWILFFAAAKLNASVCLAGMTTGTLWTSLLEPILHRRRPKTFEITLGLMVIVGLYVVFRFEFNHVWALLMAIASAFFGALFTVINAQFVTRHSSAVITLYEMLGAFIATALFLPFYVFTFAEGGQLALVPTLLDAWYIFLLAGVCTVYAYSMGVKLMKKFTAFAVNLTVNLEPVYGIILAAWIFGREEQMTLGFYLGTLIILIAVFSYPFGNKYFATRRRRHAQRLLARRHAQQDKSPDKPSTRLSSTMP